ncbi:ATP-binding cassette domain-containing protein [Scytonema sp. UIC 10036]|uniref:ABC transporter ATP-binding protein n=1 Tax=Scytonema sp. UIC 10036 TaxID=2304196 RepID=UPI0012DA39D5|nr:ABC transporter ATP-binding protein [Scytonema sp. UIC 10036]MUG96927.1 ATP-binding cassette domain-containing protein [Scytonema sp. UIC 10036]
MITTLPSTPIQIRDLSKTYSNGHKALSGVNLDIPMGMFGLLGPNGAGKSSLMRTIGTLQEADSGTIQWGNINVLEEKIRVRQVLGYLPQNFGVYPDISAENLLNHFAALKGITNGKERKALVNYLLQQVNLYEARDRAVSGFSGGMRQRFGIAQALLGDPHLVIVDEPTAGLDPAERVRFLNLLSEISQRAAIILSTHIVDDVSELCPHMAVLTEGSIRVTGQPMELMQQLSGKVWRIRLNRDELPIYEKKFQILSTRFFMGDIIARIYSESDPGAGFESVEPNLEDVYFCVMKSVVALQPRALTEPPLTVNQP